MEEENLEKFLELMSEMVKDDTMPWKEKAARLQAKVRQNENWEIALPEFLSWFPEPE